MRNFNRKSVELKETKKLIFNITRENEIRVLNQNEMNFIRGGEGEESDTHQEWED